MANIMSPGVGLELFAVVLPVSITFMVFNKINEVQQTPYMDEVFHIPQGIEFCQGNFSYWDPKITTLPGLYFLSIGALVPMCKVLSIDTPCTVYSLRLTNLVAAFINLCLIYDIQRRLHNVSKVLDTSTMFNSLTLWTFPVLYFFTFLYYTDTVSTLLVLLMYDLHLVKNLKLAAFIGFVACLVRQTNIIWVGFLILETYPEVIIQNQRGASWKQPLAKSETSLKYFVVLKNYMLMIAKRQGLSGYISLLVNVLSKVRGYVLVCALFIVFVIINGAIVVGDKAAHQPAFHLLQLCYFAMFTSIMAAPYFIVEIIPFLKAVLKNKILSLCVVIVLAILVMVATIEHPYLLADNRHYVFYVWQRVYRKHTLFRYILIPLYMFGIYGLMQQIKSSKITFHVHFCICLFLCLVPQKLLEYRYFIVPYLLFRLNIVASKWQLVAECCMYVCINAVTVYLFLTKTFYWPDSEEKQRIIW